MSDPCKDLQSVFLDILKDMMSMSADVIKWSDKHFEDVETLNIGSADEVSNKIDGLLKRVNTNVVSFMNTFETAVNKYKQNHKKVSTECATTPMPKSKLSLRKNGETEETDVDFTSSEKNDEYDDTVAPNLNLNKTTTSSAAEDMSDCESEKTIQHFHAPMINGSITGGDEIDQLSRSLENGTKPDTQGEEKILKHSVGSMSFDFDDLDNDLIAAVDKFGDSNKDKQEARQQAQKDNNELLELLNKATAHHTLPESGLTEGDVAEALKILDDEVSCSSIESDEFRFSPIPSDNDSGEEWEPSVQVENTSGSETDGNLSDTESRGEDEPKIKDVCIDLKERIDHMGDSEIERLCDLHNINKRKYVGVLGRFKKRKVKRKRIVNMLSLSSSDSSSDGSATPDIEIQAQERPPSSHSMDVPDVSALADELADKLDREDDIEISSDNSVESEDEPPAKKKKEEKVKEENVTVENEEGEMTDKVEEDEEKNCEVRLEKGKGSWRNEPRLWTSSESENDSIIVESLKTEKGNVSREVPKLTTITGDTTIISSDADSCDSDDVEIIGEVTNDDYNDTPGARGRRNIRQIMSDAELNELTQRVKSQEEERVQRVEEHLRTVESFQSEHESFILDVDIKTGQPLISVNHNLTQILKPHQKAGIKFMWEACYESVKRLQEDSGTGCILAHCMGLGKTLQVITLIHTLFTHPVTQTKRILIICPLSTVTNWRNEFKKTYSRLDKEPDFHHFYIYKGDKRARIQTIQSWRERGGILVTGYETFQLLTNESPTSKINPILRKNLDEALLDPGPDLIICDEGHQLKNGKALKTKALMRVKTKRRIVLTGTPLQNDLKEYFYMVNFVKPNYLGNNKEYMNRFGTPIANGQFHDSLPQDIKLMKKRTHCLDKLLKMTIHRVESAVLAEYLPEITDYTMLIKLTPLQIDLYTKYINMVTTKATNMNLALKQMIIQDNMVLNFNNLHPYTLHLYYTKLQSRRNKKKTKTDEGMLNDDEQQHSTTNVVGSDWYKDLIPEDVASNVDYSSKLRVVLDIINETIKSGEKALIFAKYLVELDVLEHFLKTQGTKDYKSWRPNVDYYRMDGDTSVVTRNELCDQFNKIAGAKLFLLTHRVGGLGLNLIGANRVIIIGSNFNPSHDTQSVYRVYRFGQTKKCFIYRLLTLSTMEEKVYRRCVVKLHLSGTVVDKMHFARTYAISDLQEVYKIDFSEYEKERPIPKVPSDVLLALLLQNTADIHLYYQHDTLFTNRPEEELTDEDKKLAWEEFNNMEAAAKQAAGVAQPQPQQSFHPPQNLSVPIFPVNRPSPPNRFGQFRGPQWNNTSNLVPNPLNNSVRGFVPTSLLPNNGMHPNIPQILNRPGVSGLNTGSHQNDFIRVVPNQNRPQVARNNFTPAPTTVSDQQKFSNLSRILQNIARNVAARTGGSQPSSEFNYALNKVV